MSRRRAPFPAIWDGALSRPLSHGVAFLHLLPLGVQYGALRAFRLGVRMVLLGWAE